MAKALGLIGNFKGKLGNTVGYSLKDSNNKQTQGVRVYQPVVRNPKTAAQAEQRAKLAPINATYRALKMIIDRGQEGKAYGNKSRLAWLSQVLTGFDMPWFEKGANITVPVIAAITKGSLAGITVNTVDASQLSIIVNGVTSETVVDTIGKVSTAILTAYPSLKDGDQITLISLNLKDGHMVPKVDSFLLNAESTSAMPFNVSAGNNELIFGTFGTDIAGAVVVSREGDNGAHLRSTSNLTASDDLTDSHDSEAAKQAAIESYMSQGANTDWAEESLM